MTLVVWYLLLSFFIALTFSDMLFDGDLLRNSFPAWVLFILVMMVIWPIMSLIFISIFFYYLIKGFQLW